MNLPLSIIIPTKNEEAYLSRLLQSIKSQTLQPAEIIVADADSTDMTKKIAKFYGCKVVKGGNHPGIGRNKGAAAANTPLLLFLDADVILPDNNFLKSSVNEFEQKGLGVACCLAIITSDNMLDRFGVELINTYFSVTESMIKNGVGYCTFIRNDIHKAIGGINEELVITEDRDYVARASKLGKFRYIRSKKIIVSTRRYEHEGRVRLFVKYLYVSLYILLKIKITKDKIPYSFNHSYLQKAGE
jgi:glycosyltransferase involved in cell wall biosynthesis